jgi:molybdenum cofactor cytidylyltransferase
MGKAVDGVILAAGLSSRMKRPKPLLAVGAETFAERTANTLRQAGCRRIWLVVNAGAEWARHFPAGEDLQVVMNDQPESEQVDSLRLVIRALPPETDALLVLPVDMPLVNPSTLVALVAAYEAEPAPLYLPFHNTVAGHPILLDRSLFQEVLATELEEGLRSLVMSHAREMREVAVDDPGILVDIDTPDDYWRHIEAP